MNLISSRPTFPIHGNVIELVDALQRLGQQALAVGVYEQEHGGVEHTYVLVVDVVQADGRYEPHEQLGVALSQETA